jgi:hypothetical protein
MEIASVSNQSSAIQAYSVQRQVQRQQEDSEDARRPEVVEPVGPNVDRVTLSRDSRIVPVAQAENSPRANETDRTGEARTQRREQEGSVRQAANSSPRAISQALEAYSQVAKS